MSAASVAEVSCDDFLGCEGGGEGSLLKRIQLRSNKSILAK